ncbi:MAG: nucleotidyltransferase family protein [Alphaproteobacteria bacterium]|nr:nucleotidyltransferase family protein [Alphaproteobacteria bacterium]
MIQSAMILAAGFGKRMRPITETLPKPLISVGGKSLLERTFEHVRKADISNIVVNTHHLAPLVEEAAKKLHPATQISYEKVLLETGGGIKKALPLLLSEKSFFTLNGDSIWSGPNSLTYMEKAWDEEKMDALLLLVPREKAQGYKGKGDFFLSNDGLLTRPSQNEWAPYVYIGVQLTSSFLFQDSPDGSFSLNIVWDKALRKGRLYGYVHQGEWFHMSTPEDLKKYGSLIF